MLSWCVCAGKGETCAPPGSCPPLSPFSICICIWPSLEEARVMNGGKQLRIFFFFSFSFFRARRFGIDYISGLHSGGTGVWLQDPRFLVWERSFVLSLSPHGNGSFALPPPPPFPSRSVSIIYSPPGLDLTRLPARIVVVVVVLLLPMYVHMCTCV